MGKTKRLNTDPDDAAPEAASEAASVAERELEEVALQVPQGAIGTLYRLLEGGKKGWCDELAAGDFSPQWIRDRFGPGRYKVYWRAPDPKRPGKTNGAGSTPITIEGQHDANTQAGPPASRLDTTMATLVEEHVKRMLDGQDMLQQMQMAVLKNLTEPRKESELVEKILLALVTRQAPAGQDLGALVTLADRLASRTSPTIAMKETLELLDKARELAGGGEGEAAPAWLRVAAHALDTIGRAVSAPRPAELAPGPDSGTPAPAPGPGAAALPPAGVVEVETLPPTAHAVFHFLAPHIPPLLRHAELDHDPTTYAGVLFDEIAIEYLPEVRDYISRPDFFELLAAAFPIVQAAFTRQPDARRWFEELRDDLVDRIRTELEPPAAEVH